MNVYMPIRCRSMIALTVAAVVTIASDRAAAQQQTALPIIASYAATATNLKRVSGETITANIRNWSSDDEREKLLAVLAKGPNEVLQTLQQLPTKGIVWRSGSALGMFIRYAARVKQPDGGERVILAVDRDLSSWQDVSPNANSSRPFTVIELRFSSKGLGEGKMSIGTSVTADSANKTLALAGYEGAPVVLKGARRQALDRKPTS